MDVFGVKLTFYVVLQYFFAINLEHWQKNKCSLMSMLMFYDCFGLKKHILWTYRLNLYFEACHNIKFI